MTDAEQAEMDHLRGINKALTSQNEALEERVRGLELIGSAYFAEKNEAEAKLKELGK